MSVSPGTRLGPYEITAKLGEGGMGEVWRAIDTKLKREVAIKVLPEAFTEDKERLARFEREAQLLAQLQHPNIASIYGLEESDGTRALVMELVEGPTLADRLESGGLSLSESLSIARQIAEALEEAHEKGIIHRDLKPQNVKASIEGKVKVLDFGLAKAMDAGGGVSSAPDLARSPTIMNSPTLTAAGTQLGMILGTAAYMAPEQARGSAVDKRADIWAFGVVLFEMLSGRSVFAADTVPDTLAAVLTRELEFDLLPESTPPAIRRLLRRALERNPRNRLRDVGDARIVLDETLAGRGDEPRAAAVAPSPVRGRRLWLAALPIGAALGAVLAISLRSTPPPPLEPVRIQRLTFSGDDYHPAASPDGRFVAFTSGRGGTSRIWLKQMEGGGEQRLTNGNDFNPRFAPDGNSLGFLRENAEGPSDLYRIALVGGQPRRLLANVSDFDWSPDGRSLAFLRELGNEGRVSRTQLGVADLASGNERKLLELEGWVLLGVRWRPDGGHIAVTRGAPVGAAGGWRLLLVDPVTGASEDLGANEGLGTISASAWDPRGTGLYYAASPDNVGDLTGAPAAVRHLTPGGKPRTLFWAAGLFPFRGSGTVVASLSLLGPGRLVFDSVEQVEVLREIDLDGGASRHLTRSLGADRQPAYSPDGRSIVFSSNRTGNLDLWLVDRASGELRQLTDDASQDWDPGFTPDGRRVLFSSSRGGNLEIWSLDLDGSNARQVSADGVDAENPTMTPDGRWIVYTSGNSEHLGLFRIRPDGSESAQITTGNHTNGEVSPAGRWALFVSNGNDGSDIFFVEIETGRLAPARIEVPSSARSTNVTFGRGRWNRGGKSVVFVGLDEQGRTGLFEQDFDPERDTSATRRQLAGFFDDGDTESFGVAPDGSAVTIAVPRTTRSLVLAEGLPEAAP